MLISISSRGKQPADLKPDVTTIRYDLPHDIYNTLPIDMCSFYRCMQLLLQESDGKFPVWDPPWHSLTLFNTSLTLTEAATRAAAGVMADFIFIMHRAFGTSGKGQ